MVESPFNSLTLDATSRQQILLLNYLDRLRYWSPDKMANIWQTTFSDVSQRKTFEIRIKFHWNMFVRVSLTICRHWYKWWLGAEQATSHYLNQWWPTLLLCFCITRSQCFDRDSFSKTILPCHKYCCRYTLKDLASWGLEGVCGPYFHRNANKKFCHGLWKGISICVFYVEIFI